MKLTSPFTPSPAQRESWRRWKRIGKKAFVLRVGVLGWGGIMFIVITALDLRREAGVPHGSIYYALDILLHLLLWLVAGYCFGLIMWSILEKKVSESDGPPARQQ